MAFATSLSIEEEQDCPKWNCLGCVTAAHVSISQSYRAPSWLVSNVIPASWFLCCDFLPVHLNLPWHQCPSFFAWPGQGLLPWPWALAQLIKHSQGAMPKINQEIHTHTKMKRFLTVECSKALKEISWVPTDQMGHNSAVRVKARHETAAVPI